MVCSTLLSSSLCVKNKKNSIKPIKAHWWLGAVTSARSRQHRLMMTKSTLNRVRDRKSHTHTATTDILLLTIESDDIMPCPHTNRHLILVFVFIDPVQISELLAKTIGDAHSRTCLFSGEHIADMLRKPQDISKVHYYKNMVSRSSLWSPIQKLSTKRFSIHFFPNSFISFTFRFILGID